MANAFLTCKRAIARCTKGDRGARRDTGLQFEDATSAIWSSFQSSANPFLFIYLLSSQFPHAIIKTGLDKHPLAKQYTEN
jgi:hypothetical protein